MKYHSLRAAPAALCAALMLCACSAPASGIQTSKAGAAMAVSTAETAAPDLYRLTAYERTASALGAYSPYSGVTVTGDKGYVGTVMDFSAGEQRVLCSASGCTHDSDACPAWLCAWEDPSAMTPRLVYDGGTDTLYWLVFDTGGGQNGYIDASAADGTDRTRLMDGLSAQDITCVPSNSDFLSDGEALYWVTYDGFYRFDTEADTVQALARFDQAVCLAGVWQDRAVLFRLGGETTSAVAVSTGGQRSILPIRPSGAALSGTVQDGLFYQAVWDGGNACTLEAVSLADGSTQQLGSYTAPVTMTAKPYLTACRGDWLQLLIFTGDSSSQIVQVNAQTGSAVMLPDTQLKDGEVPRPAETVAETGDRILLITGSSAESTVMMGDDGIPFTAEVPQDHYELLPLSDYLAGDFSSARSIESFPTL